MIEYSSKHWLSVIFDFHKTHIIKILFPSVLAMGVYTGIFIWTFQYLFHTLKIGSTSIHSLLGFVLGLLLVFRTNTAYERWWEGRRHWGTLVNSSRNLALKVDAFLPPDMHETRLFYQKSLSHFCLALKDQLEGSFSFSALDDINEQTFADKKHIPNAIAGMMFHKTNELYKSGIISGEQLMILDKQLESLTDVTGACERIKSTPIPYSYNLHLKKYIFLYSVTLPWGLMGDMKYWAIPAVMMVFYAMVGIELIGEEIEDPFSGDPDDLPLGEICQKIHNSVAEILVKSNPAVQNNNGVL